MSAEENSPERLGKWMRSEHQTLASLTQVLKEHLARMPEVNSGEWLHGLRSGFERFHAHIKKNFACQESDGYLDMILEQRPTLSGKVELLRREHAEMLRMAERLHVDLSECAAENRLLLADNCARLQRFMAVVAQHNQRENMLTLLVFNEDIGVGD